MSTFQAVNDQEIAGRIARAEKRVVYLAPGVGSETADALINAIIEGRLAVTVILDSGEDAYRIGYGDHEALARFHEEAVRQQFPIRSQAGSRIGVLLVDEELVVWAPTARSVESERSQEQPNGIVIKGSVVDQVNEEVGGQDSGVLASEAQVGYMPMKREDLDRTVERLRSDPPAPFELSRKTRVFSSRFQFVEFEVRGAEWSERKIKLSSFFLNADLPDQLKKVLETQIRPFQQVADKSFEIPVVVGGVFAYQRDGSPMMRLAKQADIMKQWHDVRDRFLKQVKGFGWLIRRDKLAAFRREVGIFEECLTIWVDAFREHAKRNEGDLVDDIVKSLAGRLQRAGRPSDFIGFDVRSEVLRGFERMRVVQPQVRIVLKNVTWESSSDREFLQALQSAYSQDELEGWFEEYTAARQAST